MKDDKEAGKPKNISNDQDNSDNQDSSDDLIKKFKEDDEIRQKKLGDEMDKALGKK